MSFKKFNKCVNILASSLLLGSGLAYVLADNGVDRIDNVSDIFLLIMFILCLLLFTLASFKFISDKIHRRNIYVTDLSIEECKKRVSTLGRKLDSQKYHDMVFLKKTEDGEMIFKCYVSERNTDLEPRTMGVKFKEHGNQTLLICKIKVEPIRFLVAAVLCIATLMLSLENLIVMFSALFVEIGDVEYYVTMFATAGFAWVATFAYGGAFATWRKYDRELCSKFSALSYKGNIADNILKLPKKL